MTAASLLAEIAESQLGVVESPRGSNSGSAVKAYQEATNLRGTGWPWCAAFIDWCVAQLIVAKPTGWPDGFVRPKTPSAFGLLNWARATPGCRLHDRISCEVRRGDIVVYTFSHCGIVTDPPLKGSSSFKAVEGNTDAAGGREGWQVASKLRSRSQVRGFISLPI